MKLPMRPNGITGYVRPGDVLVQKVNARIDIDLSGISAFSDVLTGWAQGGPIAIHGTNAPWSIGRAVSNGCIRVPNETLGKLFGATVGGEPVVIHP